MSMENSTHRSQTFAGRFPGLLSPSNRRSLISKTEVRMGDVIKGQTTISYIPFEKKITAYETRQIVERVPVMKTVIDYEERRYIENVPREVTKMDYMAVEHITQYVKEVVPERTIEMLPVQKKVKRIEYIPVQKQTIHYPDANLDPNTAKRMGESVLTNQGFNVRQNAQFKPLSSKLLYQYTENENRGSAPVGYFENGISRELSNTAGELIRKPDSLGQYVSSHRSYGKQNQENQIGYGYHTYNQ